MKANRILFCTYNYNKQSMNTPTLETARLILRRFTERDMEALFLILKDEETNRFLPWYPMKDIEETKLFYKEKYAIKYRKSIWKNITISVTGFARNFGIRE